MKATRTRHGPPYTHTYIHTNLYSAKIVRTNLRRHFDLFRTWRKSSLRTVAWQLVRFQLTRRIARSLGDSWASWATSSSIHPILVERPQTPPKRLWISSLKPNSQVIYIYDIKTKVLYISKNAVWLTFLKHSHFCVKRVVIVVFHFCWIPSSVGPRTARISGLSIIFGPPANIRHGRWRQWWRHCMTGTIEKGINFGIINSDRSGAVK